MADLNITPVTYDNKNLPVTTGLNDLLQKTGKIANTSLGQQVISNNQINNLIDVTKLNLPALQAYGFSGYSNLSSQEQDFLNNQSINQTNQYNTLQNQLILSNYKANQATAQQIQDLKSSTGKLFDSAGINQNNSTLGLSYLNNANNIGAEQVRINNQELTNQLSQGLNQFQQGQVQLQGQATQQAQANKQYARSISESDRVYNTNATGNLQVINPDGTVTTVKDSKEKPVYTLSKYLAERDRQDKIDQYYTGTFGVLYNKNKPVLNQDGAPVYTQAGLSNINAIESGDLANAQSALNINKILALQDSDIATELAKNAFTLQQSKNNEAKLKDFINGSSGGSITGKVPTLNSPSFNSLDAKQVQQYSVTADERKLLSFKDKDGNDVADKNAAKNSPEYISATEKDVKMKATFGEGYGSLFDIEIIKSDISDPNSVPKYNITNIKSNSNSAVFSPYTFADVTFDDPKNAERYQTARAAYSQSIKNTINGDGGITQLYIKSQIGIDQVNSKKPVIVGITGYSGDPYDKTSNTNFAEINTSLLSDAELSEFQNEYYEIANIKKKGVKPDNSVNTTDAIYNRLINKWNGKKPGFATSLSSSDVIGKMSDPSYVGTGLTKIEGQVTRDLLLGLITTGNNGAIKTIADEGFDTKGLSFNKLSTGIKKLAYYNEGDNFSPLDFIKSAHGAEFDNIAPNNIADMVKTYNGLSQARKTEIRSNLKSIFTSTKAEIPSMPYDQNRQNKLFGSLGKFGFGVDTKKNNSLYSTKTTEVRDSIASLFNYAGSIKSSDQLTKFNQVKSVFMGTGINDVGLADMLADIFTFGGGSVK